ncbi:type VI secretion system baseplate subunit TssE [Teredinibacter sp. KSP-S5-2]|uniref:type VI secretion system baseplate subunit TssE n=1 Tax=Teredinibacter sp. KSP-S5-2 TaxID=3034506 RepID=UPI002934515E|nr:type VI secretion system baseplate subunit TssE [Teredinibacter sp. KSP-S5-2]WNO08073.1 type VI secretion system baseplate subunit TssE [Teredinibacter sp. KSP-S5-2]
MARVDKKKNLRPSILDRLIDDEPHLQVETEKTRHQRLKELRNSVRRDLENLLNSRYRVISPPEELQESNTSLLNYGLPDLATVNIVDLDKKREFTQNLERVLKTYEPRFKSVKVSYQDNKDNTDRTLRFRIDATLYADPAPEIVVFDSILEPASRAVNVEESQHG